MTDVALLITDDNKFSERRNGGVRRLLVTFDHSITTTSFIFSSVLLAGRSAAGSLLDLSLIGVSVSLTSDNTVGIIDFSPALPDYARYLVRLQGVTDAAGNALYGTQTGSSPFSRATPTATRAPMWPISRTSRGTAPRRSIARASSKCEPMSVSTVNRTPQTYRCRGRTGARTPETSPIRRWAVRDCCRPSRMRPCWRTWRRTQSRQQRATRLPSNRRRLQRLPPWRRAPTLRRRRPPIPRVSRPRSARPTRQVRQARSNPPPLSSRRRRSLRLLWW